MGVTCEVDGYRVRLVARGFSQTRGNDFQETFAPIAKLPSIRTMLALAAALDLEIHQMDAKTAFLNVELEEVIYMVHPEGYKNKEHKDYVCRLNKAIYGLKQAQRVWNEKIDSVLLRFGFQSCQANHSIYRLKNKKLA
jgi:hypothetical protein